MVPRDVAEVGREPRQRTSGPEGSRGSSSPRDMVALSIIATLKLGSSLKNYTRYFKDYSAWTPDHLKIGISADGVVALGFLESSPKDLIRHRQLKFLSSASFAKPFPMGLLIGSGLYRKVKPEAEGNSPQVI